MKKTCTRISFSLHNSQDSEFESALGTNFNDNSRRGANRKRTSRCKDIEAGHNVKMPPRFPYLSLATFRPYPNPLATTHYPVPLSFFLTLGFRCATYSTCSRPFIHHKWQKKKFPTQFSLCFCCFKNIFHMSAAGCNYAINYRT